MVNYVEVGLDLWSSWRVLVGGGGGFGGQGVVCLIFSLVYSSNLYHSIDPYPLWPADEFPRERKQCDISDNIKNGLREHGWSQGSDYLYIPACFCRAERKAEPLPTNKS